MPFTVYVVRLKPDVLLESKFRKHNPKHKSGMACVYVGESWHEPELRYQKHLAGDNSCPYVEKYPYGLHKKLTRRGDVFETREESVARQNELAAELQAEGYAVWWG